MSVDVLSLIGILPNNQEFEIYESDEDNTQVYKAKVGYMAGQCSYLARDISYIRVVHNVIEIYLDRVTQD